jgi:hypothetical protein
MADHARGRFAGVPVALDGNTYTDCFFTNCNLTYSGGALPSISGCHFEHCRFELVGAAANTLALLKAMTSPTSGMQTLVRETFRALRLQ